MKSCRLLHLNWQKTEKGYFDVWRMYNMRFTLQHKIFYRQCFGFLCFVWGPVCLITQRHVFEIILRSPGHWPFVRFFFQNLNITQGRCETFITRLNDLYRRPDNSTTQNTKLFQKFKARQWQPLVWFSLINFLLTFPVRSLS